MIRERPLELAELRAHGLAERAVERPERLVHQEDAGAEDERPGQRHPLLLAARQLAREPVAVPRQAHQRRASPPRARPPRRAETPRTRSGKGHVLADRQVRKERVVLEHHADLAAMGRQPGHVHAVDPDRAGVGRLEPGDQVQGGRLAAARGAEERQELARLDRERQLVDRRHGAESLREAQELEAGAGPRREPVTTGGAAARRRPRAPPSPAAGVRRAGIPTTPDSGEPRDDAEQAQRHHHLKRRHRRQERVELVLGDRAPHLPRERRGGRAPDEERDDHLVERDDGREEHPREKATARERERHAPERLPRRRPETPRRALESQVEAPRRRLDAQHDVRDPEGGVGEDQRDQRPPEAGGGEGGVERDRHQHDRHHHRQEDHAPEGAAEARRPRGHGRGRDPPASRGGPRGARPARRPRGSSPPPRATRDPRGRARTTRASARRAGRRARSCG